MGATADVGTDDGATADVGATDGVGAINLLNRQLVLGEVTDARGSGATVPRPGQGCGGGDVLCHKNPVAYASHVTSQRQNTVEK